MKQVPKGWECVRGDRGTPGQGRLKRSKNWNHDPPSHLVWDASAFQTSPPPVKITTMIIITMVTTWCIRSSKVPIASSFSLRPASWCWMVEPWLMITWWWEVKINHYKLADYADFDDDQPTDAGMLSLGWRWWWLWWRLISWYYLPSSVAELSPDTSLCLLGETWQYHNYHHQLLSIIIINEIITINITNLGWSVSPFLLSSLTARLLLLLT